MVNGKHRLIPHHKVTNAGNDTEQLAAQAIAAQAVLAAGELLAMADAGYFSEGLLAECAQAGITVCLPVPDDERRLTAKGRLSGAHFAYLPERDVYRCPGDQELHRHGEPAPAPCIRLQGRGGAPHADTRRILSKSPQRCHEKEVVVQLPVRPRSGLLRGKCARRNFIWSASTPRPIR